jgi:hypothetical protein
MNFFKTLKFDKHKIEKRALYESNLLNEIVKHPLFKPNFDIGNLFLILNFQYPYYSISTTFHDTHAIKVAPHKQMQ